MVEGISPAEAGWFTTLAMLVVIAAVASLLREVDGLEAYKGYFGAIAGIVKIVATVSAFFTVLAQWLLGRGVDSTVWVATGVLFVVGIALLWGGAVFTRKKQEKEKPVLEDAQG